MIKFAIRRNLIYPLQLLFWSILRDIETLLISEYFNLNNLLLFNPLMFLGEFVGGLMFYKYLKKYAKERKKGEPIKFMNIEYIQTEIHFTKKTNKKIYFLLFAIGFFDFIQFSVSLQFGKFIIISSSLEQRLRGIYTINYALIYYYILGLPVYKHQYCSLIIIGICIIVIIFTEFIFQEFNIFLTYAQFCLAFFINICSYIF